MVAFSFPRTAPVIVGLSAVLAFGCGDSGSGGKGGSGGSDNRTTDQIGPNGGAVSDESGASVNIPAGALSSETAITIGVVEGDNLAALPAGLASVGPFVELTPHGTQFAIPATVRLPYSASTTSLSVIGIDDENDTLWEEISGASFGEGVATVEIDHFSFLTVAASASGGTGGSGGSGGTGSGGSGGDGGGGGTGGGFVNLDGITYLKASNTDPGDGFGTVSLSADGQTLAVGAKWEASASTGVNGDQTDNSDPGQGAVYVFTRDGDTWSQQAYIKGDEMQGQANSFGVSVSLAADGDTLAVGGLNFGVDDATVYVFVRTGSNWSQQARLALSLRGNLFGASVGLSADGNTLAVGDFQDDGSALNSGAVYVFTRNGNSWTQQEFIKASNPGVEDRFGISVSLAADGNALAVGADGEDSATTGVNGDQDDNSASFAGAAYVFSRAGDMWSQDAYIKASGTAAGDWFGKVVSLSGQGDALAVGASKRSGSGLGAAYVFTRSGSRWSQQASVGASNHDPGDSFGSDVRLNADATVLAVGAGESSGATGVNGDQTDNSAEGAGAVYLFRRDGSTWSQQAYVKASNTDAGDGFGDIDPLAIPTGLGLSADGQTLAVGAYGEDSADSGVNGDQTDNSAAESGAAYVYELE